MIFSKLHLFFVLTTFLTLNHISSAQPINRKAVVNRHNVKLTQVDSLNSLTVGNGAFAFTVDITGLQTFPEYYKNGVPLGTQSEWGWHSFPNKGNYKFEESLANFPQNGRQVSYSVQPKKASKHALEAVEYFRVNEHRLQLGNVGLDIYKKDGSLISISDIKNIEQVLDPWTGIVTSKFTIEGSKVQVITCAYQNADAIGAKIESPLLKEGRIKVRIRFPYPNGKFKDEGVNYDNPEKHTSGIVKKADNSATFEHKLDDTRYSVIAGWNNAAKVEQKSPHYFTVTPEKGKSEFEINWLFTSSLEKAPALTFSEIKNNSIASWEKFWKSGAAIDFEGSTDKRASELERRVVLSQYLTKVQCAGNFPPQETGLTYNSWFGKPHLEMFWWHTAHYALWNRTEYLEKSLDWYFKVADEGKKLAERQGYEGIRWQKMVDHQGNESPSSVGSFLIWQQPHFLYLAEMVYQNKGDAATLNKYKDLIFATADFMASFPTYDKEKKQYNLGKGLIPAQECFEPMETFNPTYELAYWSWGLDVAQKWRERAGLPRNKKWDDIIQNLAPLPQKNGVYLATESTPDCYEPGNKRLNDHPAVLASLSTIPPANHLDSATLLRTFDLVEKVWNWDHTWGWDFPLVAMTATRLRQPEKAVNALFKNITTNTYLPNGHNYQDKRLTIYLPGNGGVLAAVALMCTGSKGNKEINPGFPKDGTWKVRWEGLTQMP